MIIKLFFLFYLKYIITLLGKIFLGNPDNYRHLAMYTTSFNNAKTFSDYLKEEGLQVTYFEHFFGCASGVYGSKVTS